STGLLRGRSLRFVVERRLKLQAQSETAHMRRLMDDLDVIVWEATIQPFAFTHVSKGAEALLGYPADLWLEDPNFWEQRIHPDDRESTVKVVKEAAELGRDHILQYRMIAEDDKVVWVSDVARVAIDDRGDVQGLRGRMVDITEQMDAEKRLAAVHAATLAMTEAPDLKSATSTILRGVCETLGWHVGVFWEADEDQQVLRCIDLWSDDDPRFASFVNETRQNEFSTGEGLPGRVWAAGRPIWVSDVTLDEGFSRKEGATSANIHGAFAFPVKAGKELLGVIEFFSQRIEEPDIELLQMTGSIGGQIGQFIERARAEEAVRESEARKAAIVESALDCIITIDHLGHIIEFNPASEKTFGFAKEEILGRTLEETIIPQSRRIQHVEGLDKYLATGEGPILNRRIEQPALRADGSEILVELTITAVHAGDTPLFTGYLRDITEERKAEEVRSLLEDVSSLMATSLDYAMTLAGVAGRLVPYLGDLCLVDVVEDGRVIHRVAAFPGDIGNGIESERTYLDTYLVGLSPEHPMAPVFAGESVLRSSIDRSFLERWAGSDGPEKLGWITSFVSVPLKARDKVIGAITLLSRDPRRSLDHEALSIAEKLARRVGVPLDNALLYKRRSLVAHTLQESLKPRALPSLPGIEIAHSFTPAGEANEVGGDFYDLFEYSSNKWALVIGDVSGKGATAAALTGFVRNTIQTEAMKEHEPRRVLTMLNQALVAHNPNEQFCTAAYMRIVPTGRGAHLTLVCGGHPLPILLHADGTAETVGRPGSLLGVYSDVELHEEMLEINAGEAIIFYTDGVTEARVGSDLYGEERLVSLVRTCTGMSAERIAETIEQTVQNFVEFEVRDDMALIVLKIPE
ncbi:MAG TPA: SpoIIE family protein phosphatase, partial [Actinomycetota bacterium]|nr:SpoIIE family protein phosphatase [Actinomycetota bacterium]